MNEIKTIINEQLQQLQMLMHRSSFNHFNKVFNPHREQGRILAILKLKSEISQRELTYLLNMSKQSVAELIAKLEKNGYITRKLSEEDKRVLIIKLTQEGAKATDDVDDITLGTAKILSCLEENEQIMFSKYLGRIIKQYEEQFPNENFEQQRQMMEEFMSSFGHGHNFGKDFSAGMMYPPFMNGDFCNGKINKISKKRTSKLLEDIVKINEQNKMIFDNIENTVGNISVKRTKYLENISNLLSINDLIVISGPRGNGKSAIVKQYIESNNENTFVLFRAEEFDKTSFSAVLAENNIESSLEELSGHFQLYDKKIIVIDSIEKILELKYPFAFIDLLKSIALLKNWKIICTARDYSLETLLFSYLANSELEHDVISIEEFSEIEMKYIIDKTPLLQLVGDNENIKSLMKNPFYLKSINTALILEYKIGKTDSISFVRDLLWKAIVEKIHNI